MEVKSVSIYELENNVNIYLNKTVKLSGWVRFNRPSKQIGFIELFDGSFLNGIQLVYKEGFIDELKNLQSYTTLEVEGTFLEGRNDSFEIQVTKIVSIFESDVLNYLGKKSHSLEYLRSILHLRSKTKLFQSVMKIRSLLFQEIHNFFRENEFIYLTTPIITSNDAEGAGEAFLLHTQNEKQFWSNSTGSLSVSGQLHAESYAQSFKKVYVLSPAFRAEKSNTTRHISEFWMLEPEVAFSDYFGSMDLAENLIKTLLKKVLIFAPQEIKFLSEYNSINLGELFKKIIVNKFKRISYREALKILKEAISSGVKFSETNIDFGLDLGIEHEKYLTKHFDMPVFVYDYPKSIKAFYMYRNNDGETVRGFDLLVPKIGELVGGSQREDRYDVLKESINQNIDKPEDLEWYLNLRKSGYNSSSGFGLGIERLIMLATGMENIRDVIPFPRSPGILNY